MSFLGSPPKVIDGAETMVYHGPYISRGTKSTKSEWQADHQIMRSNTWTGISAVTKWSLSNQSGMAKWEPMTEHNMRTAPKGHSACSSLKVPMTLPGITQNYASVRRELERGWASLDFVQLEPSSCVLLLEITGEYGSSRTSEQMVRNGCTD